MRAIWQGAATLGVCLLLIAQTGMATEDGTPPFQKMRYQEDYSYLRDPAKRTESLDDFKFIPLNKLGNSYLTLGGEVRQRYAYTANPLFGATQEDKTGVWLQRYVVHGDLHIGPYLRFFGQLYSALETGRNGSPSPVGENQLVLQNGFFELNFPPIKSAQLKLRAGRQEMQFGSGRLIDVREGPNVRRTFDAMRFIYELPDWRIDAIVARPRLTRPGAFDDRANRDQALWGVYATGGQDILPIGQVDLYYLGIRNNKGNFAQGYAREVRHSLGSRLWGKAENWDYNWEAIYQFGTFGVKNISAWTVASETGYTWFDTRWRPRLALSANIASGDGNPDDGRLGTFNPLFPRGNYFSQAAVLGPRNFFNLHPYVTVSPTSDWKLTTDVNFFWRLQSKDGVYGPSGQLIRPPNGSDARFVGSAISFTSDWTVSRHFVLSTVYAHFFPGPFIKESGPAESIDYIEFTIRYRF
jgi:Alginate export